MFLINENFFGGYNPFILNILYILSILSSILVIISKNPIISVIFLIGLFLNISLYLIISGLVFIGLSYLIVYIGAVSILFLFILMLINIRLSELQSSHNDSISLSIVITLLSLIPFFEILPENISKSINLSNMFYYILNINNKYIEYKDKKPFFLTDDQLYVFSNIWDANLGSNSHITAIGNIRYTNYNIWLIIVSLILLLTMIGTIIITIKQEK
jgi:NADH-ubiquinone oxidoreductase chain 6